jgi:hypothetical protein
MKIRFVLLLLFKLFFLYTYSQSLVAVNLFSHPAHESGSCSFCRNVEDKNWKAVEKQIRAHVKEKESGDNPDLRNWLLQHPAVNYAYPMGEVLASLPSYGEIHIGFKDGECTSLYNAGIKLGTVRKNYSNPYTNTLVRFEPLDSTWKLQAFKSNWFNLFHDTIAFKEGPPLVIPSDLYFQAFLGTKDTYRTIQLIRKNIRSAIDTLHKEKDVIGLCLMMCSHNIDTRYYVLKALQELNDPRAIPMLVAIAGLYRNHYQPGSEVATIYQNFCRELANTLDRLCNTRTGINAGMDNPQERLTLGFAVWEKAWYLTDKGVRHAH